MAEQNTALAQWQKRVNESFFELNEQTLPVILQQFHELMDEQEMDELAQISFVASAARQIQMPALQRIEEREITQYTTILNMVVPNLASESPFIQALSLAFIPRLCRVLTPTQITDVVANLLACVDVYTQTEMALPTLSCLLALFTVATEVLLQLDSLHTSVVDILCHSLKVARKTKNFNKDVQNLLEGISAAFALKVAQSAPFQQLPSADDVSVVTNVLKEILATIKCFQFRSQPAYIIYLDVLRESSVIHSLLRTPNYLSAAISYSASQLLNSADLKVRNSCRGFLAQLFTIDWFIGEGQAETILKLLKCDLSEGLNAIDFKKMVAACYESFIQQRQVPRAAAVPVRVE